MTEQPTLPPADEINLLEYLHAIVRGKWIILLMALIGAGGGYMAAKYKGPRYISDAVIAPKEADAPAGPNLSSLGMLGVMASSQLSLGGTATLDKVTQTLATRTFRIKLIDDNGLLPLLMYKDWDTISKKWKDTTFVAKETVKYVGLIDDFIKTESKDDNLIITVTHPDSLAADSILRVTIHTLDRYLRNATIKNANENREYLEEQLETISDPLRCALRDRTERRAG